MPEPENHIVNLGDTIFVCGQAFVVTEMRQVLGKPSTLTTKQPVELLQES